MNPLQFSENTQEIFNCELKKQILHNLIISAGCVSVPLLLMEPLLYAECHVDRRWWCCASTVI